MQYFKSDNKSHKNSILFESEFFAEYTKIIEIIYKIKSVSALFVPPFDCIFYSLSYYFSAVIKTFEFLAERERERSNTALVQKIFCKMNRSEKRAMKRNENISH